jgi:hypothetical protein
VLWVSLGLLSCDLGLDFCYFPFGGGVHLLGLEMLARIFARGEAVLVLLRGARKCIFSKFLIIDPSHIIEHGSPQKNCPIHDGFSISLRDEMFCN